MSRSSTAGTGRCRGEPDIGSLADRVGLGRCHAGGCVLAGQAMTDLLVPMFVLDHPDSEVADLIWEDYLVRYTDWLRRVAVTMQALCDRIPGALAVLRSAGLLPPDPTTVARGTLWRDVTGDRYRMVANRHRGPHWCKVGPTRERWWR
jgi:hypothetical protein